MQSKLMQAGYFVEEVDSTNSLMTNCWYGEKVPVLLVPFAEPVVNWEL